MHTNRHIEIAIIGGGLGGLVLARTLQLHGIGATVFERESGPDVRSQGGSLDLHPESGQRALETAGLIDDFWQLARADGEELRIVDPSGHTVMHRVPDETSEPAARPEIDRAALRDLLLGSLPADTVVWDHRLVALESVPEGGHLLRFAGGTTVTCDLVVGADGSRSLVRPLLTDATPAYRYAYVELGIPDADRTAPTVAAMVGPGSLWGIGSSLNLMAQRNGDGRVRVSVSARADEGWMTRIGVDPADADGTRAALKEVLKDWDPSLLAMLDATDDRIVPRAITAMPAEVGWSHRPGVTMLGDAAHLMPPAGEGANHAMLDGAELATAIAGAATLDDAVRTYETAMFPRVSAVAAECLRMEETFLADDAATKLASMFGAPVPARSDDAA